VNSPIGYFGGKSQLAKTCHCAHAAAHCYVEPFAGRRVGLLQKPESKLEALKDRDNDIVNL
jgi:site-specific DNA-adenine methylase